MKRIIFALTILGCAPATRADVLSGLFFGGSYGRAENTWNTGSFDDQYQRSAASVGLKVKFTSSSVDRWDKAWWADAGYMPWSYLGVDALFLHAGELTHRATAEVTGPSGVKPFTDTAALTSYGPALALLARLPLTEALSIDVRLGDYYAKTALAAGTLYGSTRTWTPTTHKGSSLLASVGGSYTVAGHWSVRLDYLRVNDAGGSASIGKYSANLATLGAAFTF